MVLPFRKTRGNDSKEKQVASVLKLVIDCCFRIGNEKYSKNS